MYAYVIVYYAWWCYGTWLRGMYCWCLIHLSDIGMVHWLVVHLGCIGILVSSLVTWWWCNGTWLRLILGILLKHWHMVYDCNWYWYIIEKYTLYMITHVWDTSLGDVGTWLRYTIYSTCLVYPMVYGVSHDWVIWYMVEIHCWYMVWYRCWFT